jgi:pyruvate kinase
MGIKYGIHYVAASFVRTIKNIKEIRDFLDKNGGEDIKIVSKIENQEGVENIEAIVQLSDAIMVARGDLGIEVPMHELPYYQRYIIDACRKYGRSCIMATERLKSMTTSPSPTRAEVSDVYNSVIARVDATMLSDETAIGKFPVKSVKMMCATIKEAEKHIVNRHTDFDIQKTDEVSVGKKLLVKHALALADELKAENVVVFTHSGNLAKMVAGFKPNQMVFACTSKQSVIDAMRILYGIEGILFDKWEAHTTENQDKAIRILLKKQLIKS